MTKSEAHGVLEGIQIIELAEGIAGPTATMLLAAAGADVIKVEPPGGAADRSTPGFSTWNRSKRSVVLDLEQPQDRLSLDELLDGADALVHGYSPLEAARFGLDDTSLQARFPHLVVCGITGYPIGHPLSEIPASDALVLARAGLLDEQAAVHRHGPVYLRMPMASWGALYLAAAGVLARLLARGRTGRGGAAHTSLLQGALVPMTMLWARASNPSPSFGLGMPRDMSVSPMMRPSLFECADGVWIHVSSSPDHAPMMRAVLEELGVDDVARVNAEYGPGNPNLPNLGVNALAFARHDSARWLEELWAHDVAVQPAVAMGAILDDQQANLNGYVVEVHDPDFGHVRQAGIPFAVPGATTVRPAPALGAHTAEVRVERRQRPPVKREAAQRWPLDGLKVLDLGMFLAGPIAPMLLADLGADVIKVEPPAGDRMRYVERTFAGCQRGKRSIALDLRNPQTRDVLAALVAWADVVHHNLRLPAARQLGLGYEELHEINPRLVYCHVSSYGHTGPRADWPGFDQMFQASSGWEVEGAGEGNPPMWHRFGMMDHQGGLASLVATLLGLHWRERTGQGQHVTASLLGASVLTISETMALSDGSLTEYPRLDHDQLGIGPGRRLFAMTDGWIVVDATTPQQVEALCSVAGVSDPSLVSAEFASAAVLETLHQLATACVPATEVRLDQIDAFFDDPATWRSGLTARYPHVQYGMVEQIGGLWDLGDQSLRLDRASPALGQHTVEILEEFGFEVGQIAGLLASGAVVDWAESLRTP